MAETGNAASPRRIVALMMALAGALFFFVLLSEDMSNATELEWRDLPTGLILRYVAAMAAGGALAGLLASGLFGRGGFLGWVLAGIGGVFASLVAGMLGSAVGRVPDLLASGLQMAELLPILFGMFVLPLAAAGRPIVALAWLVLVVATHLWALRIRRGG